MIDYYQNIKIAVLASGGGSNFRVISEAIKAGDLQAEIVGLVTNSSSSGAKEYAESSCIPFAVINSLNCRSDKEVASKIFTQLEEWGTELVVLAGYMKKLDESVVRKYHNRILNIHPALLPSFGGKGMYGMNVHRAAIEYGVKFSGVTVHLVDADYDTGPVVMQQTVPVLADDTPESLQKRVLVEEHKIYPEAIKLFAENRIVIEGRKVLIK